MSTVTMLNFLLYNLPNPLKSTIQFQTVDLIKNYIEIICILKCS